MNFTAEQIAGLISGEVVGDKLTEVHTVSSSMEETEIGRAHV